MGLSHIRIFAYARLVTLTTLSPTKSMSWKQLLTIRAIHDRILSIRQARVSNSTDFSTLEEDTDLRCVPFLPR